MNKNKRWLPVLLILIFIVAYEAFVIRPYTQKLQKSAPTPKTAQTTPANPSSSPTQATPAPVAASGAVTPPPVQAIQLDESSAAGFDLGEHRSAKIYRNGAIGNVVLQDYAVREKKEKTPVVLMPEGMQWMSTNPDVQACLSSLQPSPAGGSGGPRFAGSAATGTCTVEYTNAQSAEGLLNVALTLSGFPQAQGTVSFVGRDKVGSGRSTDHNYISYRQNDKHKELRDKKLTNPELPTEGDLSWLVWGDNYFATILVPDGNYKPHLVVAGPAKDEKQEAKEVLFGFQYVLQPASSATYALKLYMGSKTPERLEAISPSLKDAMNFGFFGSIARLMLWCLKGLYSIFRNWGLAIIALTLIVRLAFLPLNRKVYESSAKMKVLQPEIERIRKKYGKDPEKATQMNLEIMSLYKTQKVNPAGSCLPLLLQMPIFFGLYAALGHSLLLYQAPFVGWITDLSSPDPYYVLPVLWTVTLLGYTLLNPQSSTSQPGMPDMRWMMIAMNVFFGFLAKDWPSGLNVYLVVSNLVGVAQQFVMQRGAKKLQPIQEGA